MALTGLLATGLLSPMQSQAQAAVLAVIRAGVKKVMQALDLRIQRLQTQTILLQEAEKVLENRMLQHQLGGIAYWMQDQEDLMTRYEQELWTVKPVLSGSLMVQGILAMQQRILLQTRQEWTRFLNDPQSTPVVLSLDSRVFHSVLQAGLQDLQQLELVVRPYQVPMNDADRLSLIRHLYSDMNRRYELLWTFCRNQELLDLQQKGQKDELLEWDLLYGIN